MPNTIGDKNVSTLALEVHRSCLTADDDIIGGWTTASLRQARLLNPSPPSGHQVTEKPGGAWVQVSRLGMPLVNKVVIGLKDKDKFNARSPKGDGQFADYVTNPTLPALLETALGLPGIAPTNFPHTDLGTTFLTGIAGVNRPDNVVASEMLRLNTAIAPSAFAQQNRLDIVGNILAGGSDSAGFPNGRRPKDDVVDIALVAMMGGLCMANGNANALGLGADCNPSKVPLGATAFKLHDAVDQAVVPLLQLPLPQPAPAGQPLKSRRDGFLSTLHCRGCHGLAGGLWRQPLRARRTCRTRRCGADHGHGVGAQLHAVHGLAAKHRNRRALDHGRGEGADQ